jgi:hypothetical protein
MIFHTCKCFTLLFVYTWCSSQLTHCVNSSVTWYPKNFNHVCSMSRPIQRCAPSLYQRQFDSSLLWSFHVLVIRGSIAYQIWNFPIPSETFRYFMFVSSKYVYETFFPWVGHGYSIFENIYLSRVIPSVHQYSWNEDPKGWIQLVMMQHINLLKKEDRCGFVKIVENRCDPSLFSYLGISGSRFL